MSEGIEFDPLGTVTVEIDGTEYRLTRPKFRQWRYFKDQIASISAKAREELQARSMAVAEASEALEKSKAKDKTKLQEAFNQATAALSEFASTPFYERSSELIREMWSQLGDKPLPEDKDDWPVFLVADVTLPAQILTHWQNAPKASGAANGM